MKEPDMSVDKPVDVWLLRPGEEPPPGSAVVVRNDRVWVAVKPQEKPHGERITEQ